ncbi:hypothetical protein MmTuc01_2162 [Methanosarcina mazei Tuc01]|uniref:Uncharacterized protein n=1 Tax=Methanosarcina mazei Tuc01 TaxID=1236903 RepID=M1Q5B3_METMZ|nr:hypothetical protein MmTuc01_2162 [Methanosarcina mazei Tuc01]
MERILTLNEGKIPVWIKVKSKWKLSVLICNFTAVAIE